MNGTQPSAEPPGNATREEIMSHLFTGLVLQHSQLAMLMLGRIPDPDSGEIKQDLESAKMFIDLLEMLEHKTRQNLTPEESRLLREQLDITRTAFATELDRQAG